jgi:uncharacterized LabA/DUF88 family protein
MQGAKPIPGAGVKKVEVKKSTRVYLYIDDSNIFIEGQRTASNREPDDPSARHRFRIDFGRLLEWITEGRTLADVYLVGSRPPEVDSFWQVLPKKGIRPKIFDRQAGREKGVDHDLVAEMVETSVLQKKEDGVIAVVGGDGDYRSTLERLNKRGWELEVYFWTSGCSSLIRNTPWYVNLDPHFREFCYYEQLR